jgi:hypothetical protein
MKTSAISVLIAATLFHTQPAFAGYLRPAHVRWRAHVPRRVRLPVRPGGGLDNDGIADLLVLNEGTSQGSISVLLGNGDGTFRNGLLYSAGQGPTFMTVADVNGEPDLLIPTGKIWTLVNTHVPGGNSVCTPFLPTGN